METPEDALLREIEAYVKARNMSESYFGLVANKNSSLVKRLRKGGTVTMRTESNVRKYMADNPVE